MQIISTTLASIFSSQNDASRISSMPIIVYIKGKLNMRSDYSHDIDNVSHESIVKS